MEPAELKLYEANERERQLLLSEIGQSITSWTILESHLYRIFHHCIGIKGLNSSAAAFNAVENFRSKLGMTDAVVRIYLGKSQLMSVWLRREKEIVKISKARNFIAHGSVVVLKLGRQPAKPYVLGCSPMTPNPTKNRGIAREKRLNLKDVQSITREIILLTTRLVEFCKKLPPH